MVKNIFKFLKLTILCTVVFASSSKVNIYEAKVTNNNLNKAVNLTTMAQKVDGLIMMPFIVLKIPILGT